MREPREPSKPPIKLWSGRRRLRPGTATWAYLTVTRALPAAIVQAVDLFDMVREGPKGSAWFAYRSHDGELTGMGDARPGLARVPAHAAAFAR
ncbi:MAG: DUF3991 domain-containing protein [Janthinobacterium lividum]